MDGLIIADGGTERNSQFRQHLCGAKIPRLGAGESAAVASPSHRSLDWGDRPFSEKNKKKGEKIWQQDG